MSNAALAEKVIGFLEARRARELSALFETHGARVRSCPLLRPISRKEEIALFAERAIAREFDLIIFYTGPGVTAIAEHARELGKGEALIEALRATQLIARGPKTAAALWSFGIANFWQPYPAATRGIIDLLRRIDLAGRRVAVQVAGERRIEELERAVASAGASLFEFSPYGYAFPEDPQPILDFIDALSKGEINVVAFTAPPQVELLFAAAEKFGRAEQLAKGLREQTVCAAVGSVTAQKLGEYGISPSISPEVGTMTALVLALCERFAPPRARESAVVEGKRQESAFLKACRREPAGYTPIWLMRQAGRYMKEYNELRAKYSLLEICKRPELAAEVTLQPVERLGVDAAIIFADILLPLEAMGMELEFVKGEGPLIRAPLSDLKDVERLRIPDPEELSFVGQAIRIAVRHLGGVPVIGFGGAPFTLASYMIEGGPSRSYIKTKLMMYRAPEAWQLLMEKLVEVMAGYLKSQIAAGAQAIQLFDSWVGCLSPSDYRQYVLPYSKKLIESLRGENAPVIHFGTGTSSLLELMMEAGGDVIGVDWRVGLDEAWSRLQYWTAIQGNLDPAALLAPRPEIEKRVKDILRRAGGRPGHIFNLGHGILPETPVENVRALVDMVHEFSYKASNRPEAEG